MLFYELLDSCQQRKASQIGTLTRRPARSLIIRQGEVANGIHVILDGIVESVYYTDTDRELRLATWGQHDFVGAPHVFGSARQHWSARALTDVEILHLDQARLRWLINHFPDTAIALIQALGHKGERYSELAQRLAFHSVTQRLALALLDTWQEAVRGHRDVTSLPVPTPLELSRAIGSTRQAVGQAMRSLVASGLVLIENGRFSLPEIQTIRDMAGWQIDNISTHMIRA